MRKIICDCCGKDGIQGSFGVPGFRTFSYAVHIEGIIKCDLSKAGYVDSNMNTVSGREESWDVCNECYNRVMVPSVQAFFTRKEEFEAKTRCNNVNCNKKSSVWDADGKGYCVECYGQCGSEDES